MLKILVRLVLIFVCFFSSWNQDCVLVKVVIAGYPRSRETAIAGVTFAEQNFVYLLIGAVNAKDGTAIVLLPSNGIA